MIKWSKWARASKAKARTNECKLFLHEPTNTWLAFVALRTIIESVCKVRQTAKAFLLIHLLFPTVCFFLLVQQSIIWNCVLSSKLEEC